MPVSPALPNRLHNGATAFGVSLWRSAGALVFNARAEVLLLKRGPTARTDPGCWYSFPHAVGREEANIWGCVSASSVEFPRVLMK